MEQNSKKVKLKNSFNKVNSWQKLNMIKGLEG
jgi:hypothetical protein